MRSPDFSSFASAASSSGSRSSAVTTASGCCRRRGFGKSGDASSYTLAREFEDVAAVVDAAADVPGCVGRADRSNSPVPPNAVAVSAGARPPAGMVALEAKMPGNRRFNPPLFPDAGWDSPMRADGRKDYDHYIVQYWRAPFLPPDDVEDWVKDRLLFNAIAEKVGGEVARTGVAEYGRTALEVTGSSGLFAGLPSEQDVWMSHFDAITVPPVGFAVLITGPIWARPMLRARPADLMFSAEGEDPRDFHGLIRLWK